MNRYGAVVLSALVFASSPVVAAQVEELTTFTAGTPALASEVNDNFNTLKDAVNDNDARISAVEAGKQNRVTGTCKVGDAIVAIGANGSVTCGPTQKAGAVSLPSHAFSSLNDTGGCALVRDFGVGARISSTSKGTCIATAPVFLPDGVTVTGLSCALLDKSNDSGTTAKFSSVELRRGSGTASTTLASIPETSDSSSLQTLEGSLTPFDQRVDNSIYTYWIWVTFDAGGIYDFNTTGNSLALYGCTVTYEP